MNNESLGCQSYGIFWDIENCPIPTMERATNVIQNIKQFIAKRYQSRVGQQTEPCTFYCSCDTKLLDRTHVEALNRSGVDILHVNPIRALNGMSTQMAYKVDADSKLIENIHKFAEHHFNTKKCLLFVITGDIDFAPAIRSVKRRGFEVILLYGTNTSEEIKNCATEAHSYNAIVAPDPQKCMFTDCPKIQSGASIASLDLFTAPGATAKTPKIVSSTTTKSQANRPAPSTPDGRATKEPPMPQFIADVQNTVRSIENQDKKRTKETNDVQYNAESLRTVQEVAQVERHIALRVLQSTCGDVNQAINLLVGD